ncbi:Acyl-CoA desaturase [Penicillium brasilianum]|uniref:Acyl-CoA desaturase n=1 Tax=Penicillium brasilianum TaxID=104259 RepID=A0A1S9RLS9_PENBI|nr:Acyl-CoA desaturase [Penicillium brasilianum]
MVNSYHSSSLSKIPVDIRALSSRIDWFRLWITGGAPLIAIIIGIFWVPFQYRTAIFFFTYATASGISITAGYHRLWAHRAYSAGNFLKVILAIVSTSAGQGSIKTWCRDHRAHHRYTDTDRDPYSAHKGLFYSHYGWIVIKRKREQTGQVDVQDLLNDPIVLWQRKHYTSLFFLTAFIFPTAYCGLIYGDYAGGFIWASWIRLFLIQQGTFCVNSLAHWAGDQPYASRLSPRNSFFVALITWGEGYHNFHHEFPVDYRNGIRWFDYDPTKWFIWLCEKFNLASNLKRFPENEIHKGKFQQIQRQLEIRRQEISWGTPIDELPVWSLERYTQKVNDGHRLLLIDGVVHDVAQFVDQHPGGKALLLEHIGKDATRLFHGNGIHAHSNAAENLLSTMRLARISQSSEN